MTGYLLRNSGQKENHCALRYRIDKGFSVDVRSCFAVYCLSAPWFVSSFVVMVLLNTLTAWGEYTAQPLHPGGIKIEVIPSRTSITAATGTRVLVHLSNPTEGTIPDVSVRSYAPGFLMVQGQDGTPQALDKNFPVHGPIRICGSRFRKRAFLKNSSLTVRG